MQSKYFERKPLPTSIILLNSNYLILNLYIIHPHKNVGELIQMHKNRKNDYMQLCQAAMIYITDTILECA